MPSEFTNFDVVIDKGDGTEALVPNVTVKVRDITDADPETGAGAVALPDLLADADGHVAAGTLAIDAGRVVRFGWLRDLDVRCGSAVQITTEVTP
jgi:hypothetical protein